MILKMTTTEVCMEVGVGFADKSLVPYGHWDLTLRPWGTPCALGIKVVWVGRNL